MSIGCTTVARVQDGAGVMRHGRSIAFKRPSVAWIFSCLIEFEGQQSLTYCTVSCLHKYETAELNRVYDFYLAGTACTGHQ